MRGPSLSSFCGDTGDISALTVCGRYTILSKTPAKFAAAGTQVLLVYPGPHADLDRHAMEFLARQNPLPSNLSLLIDPDYTFTNLYGLRWDAPHETAYPSTFLIDRSGVVFYRKISHEHRDRTTAAEF
jgi:hypothetical protein